MAPPTTALATTALPTSSVLTALFDLRSDLLPRRGPSRMVAKVGAFWLLSAVLHTAVFFADDQAWAGSVSWRKPIVFSFSFALILWSFGWVLDRLPHRPRLAWGLAGTMAFFSSTEMLLIAGQQWRGRPSHFNTEEAGNALIFSLMGLSVVFISLALVGLFIWALIQRPKSPVDRLALIAGMVLVLSGLGIGQWLITLGFEYVDQFGRVPEQVIVGEAGVAKFPHAVAFHGLQVFMVCAAMLRRSGLAAPAAQRLLRMVVLGYFSLMGFSILQTNQGLSPLDLGSAPSILLILGLLLLGSGGANIVRHWLRPQPAPVPDQFHEPVTV